MRTLLIASILTLALCYGQAQSINLNFNQAKDNLRRAQLMGDVDPSYSLNQWTYDLNGIDSLKKFQITDFFLPNEWFSWKGISFSHTPVFIRNVYSPGYPVYENDGNITAQAGLQTLSSVGINLHNKWFEFQWAPELLLASINGFSPIPQDEDLFFWERLYAPDAWNLTDAFPSGYDFTKNKLMHGQSFFFLKFQKLSAGISNANNFWGSGQFHSLILSNHTGGFPHISFHSNQPLNIPFIGNIEFQMINGLLENTPFFPPYPFQHFDTNPYLRQKPLSNRYINAINVSYNPSFLKGLHIGFSRAFQQYWDNVKINGFYFPVFDIFFKSTNNRLDNIQLKDQILTAQIRWIDTKSNFELYYVYGRNDAAWNARDFVMTPQHSMSSLYGISKIFSTNSNKKIELQIEGIQMSQSLNRIVRNAGSWYLHGQMTQGWTNKGEVLGARLPLGSNQQIFNFSIFEKLKNIGFRLTRTVINEEYYKSTVSLIDPSKQWLQFSAQSYISIPYKQWLLSGKLDSSRHLNFQYQLDNDKNILGTELSVTWFPGS